MDVGTVDGGNGARGVDEPPGQAVGLGRGKPHPQRTGFMQPAAAGDAVPQFHVELDRALGTVGGESRRSPARNIGPHPFPTAATARGPRLNYSAIWRLISAGSRFERSQAYFTAPRSMTAKLSPSSQAKSRYCSTRTIAMLPRLRK